MVLEVVAERAGLLIAGLGLGDIRPLRLRRLVQGLQGRLRLVNPAKAASDPSLAEFELSVIYNPLCKLTPDEDYAGA